MNNNYKNIFKPIIDFIFSLIIFGAFLPIFIITSVLLFFNNNGRVFFLQERPGKNEKIFRIIKFKTMNDKTDLDGNLLSDELRLTGIGKIVRKLSLDEIPQLLNVIKGDMSLVGPRPLLPRYLPLYNKFQKRRHEVKPGITGWAQVNGRNTISWKYKFELDVWYVENISLKLDLKILLLTAKKVSRTKDISSKTSATMEPFEGND